MNEGYEWEEIADMAVEDLRDFLNHEKFMIEEIHKFKDKLMAWDPIIAHIDERDHDKHDLSRSISHILNEIRELVIGTELDDMAFIKEDENLIKHLNEDEACKNWRAVKNDLGDKKKLNHLSNRVRKELDSILNKFENLLALIELELKHLKKYLNAETGKETFEKKEEYYFLQLYKFVKTYKTIFSYLTAKEKLLAEKF